MTGVLASVQSLAEAQLAYTQGMDVIDLKDPAQGSLGAVRESVAASVLTWLAGRRLLSATVGDLLSSDPRLLRQVHAWADLGVDVIKIGCFDRATLAVLSALKQARPELCLAAVVFADREPFAVSPVRLAATGVSAVVLDTCDKHAGRLTDLLTLAELGHWSAGMQAQGLAVGLAGSLSLAEAPMLAAELKPDLLGFRGALCAGGRSGRLRADALARLRALVPALPDQDLPSRLFKKELRNVMA